MESYCEICAACECMDKQIDDDVILNLLRVVNYIHKYINETIEKPQIKMFARNCLKEVEVVKIGTFISKGKTIKEPTEYDFVQTFARFYNFDTARCFDNIYISELKISNSYKWRLLITLLLFIYEIEIKHDLLNYNVLKPFYTSLTDAFFGLTALFKNVKSKSKNISFDFSVVYNFDGIKKTVYGDVVEHLTTITKYDNRVTRLTYSLYLLKYYAAVIFNNFVEYAYIQHPRKINKIYSTYLNEYNEEIKKQQEKAKAKNKCMKILFSIMCGCCHDYVFKIKEDEPEKLFKLFDDNPEKFLPRFVNICNESKDFNTIKINGVNLMKLFKINIFMRFNEFPQYFLSRGTNYEELLKELEGFYETARKEFKNFNIKFDKTVKSLNKIKEIIKNDDIETKLSDNQKFIKQNDIIIKLNGIYHLIKRPYTGLPITMKEAKEIKEIKGTIDEIILYCDSVLNGTVSADEVYTSKYSALRQMENGAKLINDDKFKYCPIYHIENIFQIVEKLDTIVECFEAEKLIIN